MLAKCIASLQIRSINYLLIQLSNKRRIVFKTHDFKRKREIFKALLYSFDLYD